MKINTDFLIRESNLTLGQRSARFIYRTQQEILNQKKLSLYQKNYQTQRNIKAIEAVNVRDFKIEVIHPKRIVVKPIKKLSKI